MVFTSRISQADVEVWTAVPKSKKHKKKKAGNIGKPNGDTGKTNGIKVDDENENEEIEEEEPEPKTPTAIVQPSMHEEPSLDSNNTVNGDHANFDLMPPKSLKGAMVRDRNLGDHGAEMGPSEKLESLDGTAQDTVLPVLSTDTEARLDALANERTVLRNEVAQLRRSLEQIQGKHEEELGSFREQLEESRGEKEHAETQYRNLLGRVNTIRSQLGERLKADAVCISSPTSWPWSSLCNRKIWHKQEIG